MKPLLVTLLLAGAAAAGAQSNDHFFRSWAWRAEPGSARLEGLAGTFAAVADDPMAAVANPAGLVQIPRGELSAGLMRRSSRFVVHEGAGLSGLYWGDTLAAASGVGFVGGAVRVRPRLVVGAYLREPQALELTLGENGLLGGSMPTGALTTRVRELGGSAAFRVSERFAVGARLGISELDLEGQGSRLAFLGWKRSQLLTREDLRVSSSAGAGGATRAAVAAGVLVWPAETLRLGVMGERGVSYVCRRVAVTPPSEGEAEGSFDLHQPSRLVAGLAWQAYPRMLLTAQVDYIRYREMTPQVFVGPFSPDDYVLHDGIEPHAGLELSFPSRAGHLQVRGGIHVRSRGNPDIRYQGPDQVELNAWGHDLERVGLSVGASLLVRHLRVDVASSGGWRSGTFIGVTLRR